jgi:hypothetical protein
MTGINIGAIHSSKSNFHGNQIYGDIKHLINYSTLISSFWWILWTLSRTFVFNLSLVAIARPHPQWFWPVSIFKLQHLQFIYIPHVKKKNFRHHMWNEFHFTCSIHVKYLTGHKSPNHWIQTLIINYTNDMLNVAVRNN